ncbi:MAG: sigma-54-dependent Fis family transcriptional regulator [Bacteroidota bacterium]|jgi:two-component system response regulator HydG|nr:sigma-54-dependent Fis family transcriptional regulator [Bacteroidota bacterium]
MKKLLIIEDDMDMSQLLKRFLTKNGYDVDLAINGTKGIAAFNANPADLVLCDYRLGDMDGVEVLKKVKDVEPGVPFIIMTGYSDIRTAVNVMKMGAFDYLAKPLLPDETLQLIKRALNSQQPLANIVDDRSSSSSSDSDPDVQAAVSSARTYASKNNYVFGKSSQSKELIRQIELVAPTNYSVIIYGESGAGKEVIAQTIHKKSKRAKQPFIAMDCGAMSKELAGSELFGHEKGSFTGALGTKIGHFELANGGTIFLDEIANLPYDVQSSLLRVVQERKVKRIGGTKEIPIDVRIIVASNENLSDAYKKGKFREDLYHRFNEFHLTVAPLRERKDDIMMYANFFLNIANQELEKNVETYSPEVEDLFVKYPWYGNLREMKNVIRRAVLLTEGTMVEAKSLPFEISNFTRTTMGIVDDKTDHNNPYATDDAKDEKPDLKSAALGAEYDLIIKVLKDVNFNKSKAAQILNIDRKTLYNKMKAYNMEEKLSE